MLEFRDWAELSKDDGGDGVTGDELLTVSLPPNCDMIWLKFLLDVTLFFVTDTWIRPGDAANGDAVVDDDDDDDVVVVVCCFCSKIEIRSEIGVFPDWVSRVAILILLFDASESFFGFRTLGSFLDLEREINLRETIY